jgi:murein DD-endopeptidase MepM/ murein hydrolase activator NlpD
VQIQKRWNVIVVPNSPGRKILSFDFSARSLLIAAGVAASLLAIILTGVLLVGRAWKKQKLDEITRLESEIKAHNEEFSRLGQEFALLEQLEDKLRTIAGLKPREHSDAHSSLGGQGGSGTDLPLQEDETQLADEISRATALQRSPEQLIEASLGLRDSFEEVLDVFERESARLSCIPSINPVDSQDAWVSSGFGYRSDPFVSKKRFHDGCDIVAPRRTPIIAPSDGVVTFAGWQNGLGRTVEIEHGYGYVTVYGHADKLWVKKGDKVKRGDLIAYLGSSGRSTGPHLHYEVHLNGKLVNPHKYLVE